MEGMFDGLGDALVVVGTAIFLLGLPSVLASAKAQFLGGFCPRSVASSWC